MMEINVGFTSSRKKRLQFFDGLLRYAQGWRSSVTIGESRIQVSVRLMPLFTDDGMLETLDVDEDVHAIIHKHTDDMAIVAAGGSGGDIDAWRRVTNLKAMLSATSTAIDELSGVWRLIDRSLILGAVDAALTPPQLDLTKRFPSQVADAPSLPVGTLPWVSFPITKGGDVIRRALGTLNFPVILKRRLACGSKATHEMVVAHDFPAAISAITSVFHAPSAGGVNINENHDELEHLVDDRPLEQLVDDRPLEQVVDDACPLEQVATNDVTKCRSYIVDTEHAGEITSEILAQEFVADHGGVLFKLYVVGENVSVQPRMSVDITQMSPTLGGYYYFDSQRMCRENALHLEFDASSGISKATCAIMPGQKLVQYIAKNLCSELGLNLIGIDLIFNVQTSKYYVVDINYFPGYKGVTSAHEWILQHICDRVCKNDPLTFP